MQRRRALRRLLAYTFLICMIGGLVPIGAAAQDTTPSTEAAAESQLTQVIDLVSTWIGELAEGMGFSIEPNG